MPTANKTFDVICRGTNKDDQDMLLLFVMQMRGTLHPFRFEHGGLTHEPWRFASDRTTGFPADPLMLSIVKLKA